VKFNRAVIFDTTQNSWHGLPDEIKAPSNILRKSLNIYYLTEPREGISSRERALFSAHKDQKNDDILINLEQYLIEYQSLHKQFTPQF